MWAVKCNSSSLILPWYVSGSRRECPHRYEWKKFHLDWWEQRQGGEYPSLTVSSRAGRKIISCIFLYLSESHNLTENYFTCGILAMTFKDLWVGKAAVSSISFSLFVALSSLKPVWLAAIGMYLDSLMVKRCTKKSRLNQCHFLNCTIHLSFSVTEHYFLAYVVTIIGSLSHSSSRRAAGNSPRTPASALAVTAYCWHSWPQATLAWRTFVFKGWYWYKLFHLRN